MVAYTIFFCRKFCSECNNERILKIDQINFFAKLSTWVGCLVFWLTVYIAYLMGNVDWNRPIETKKCYYRTCQQNSYCQYFYKQATEVNCPPAYLHVMLYTFEPAVPGRAVGIVRRRRPRIGVAAAPVFVTCSRRVIGLRQLYVARFS